MIKSWFIQDVDVSVVEGRSLPTTLSSPSTIELALRMNMFEKINRPMDGRFIFDFTECDIEDDDIGRTASYAVNKIKYSFTDTSDFNKMINYRAVLTLGEDPNLGLRPRLVGFYATFMGTIDEYILYKLAKTG